MSASTGVQGERDYLHVLSKKPLRTMSASTEHRKLAAIMFTDMVGYGALRQGHPEH